MKYVICFFSLLTLYCSTPVCAQVSIGIFSTHHYPFLEREVGDGNVQSLTTNDSRRFVSVSSFSYGQGFEYGLNLSYNKKRLTFGINFSAFEGKQYEHIVQFTSRTRTAYYTGRSFRLNPYIESSFILNDKKNLRLFTQVGSVIAMRNSVNIRAEVIRTSHSIGDDLFDNNYSGGIGFGITSSLGLEYQYSSRMTAKLGVKGLFQNYKPRQRELIGFIDRDEDKLSTLSQSTIVTLYVENITLDSNVPNDPSLPSEALRISFPFSSIGIEFSINYLFGSEDSK